MQGELGVVWDGPRGFQLVRLVYNDKTDKVDPIWDPPLEDDSLEELAMRKFLIFESDADGYNYYWVLPTGIAPVVESTQFLPSWIGNYMQVPDGRSLYLPSSVLRTAYERWYGEVYLYG